MNFAELYSVLLQRCNRILRFFKFHREMAGIIIDAEVFIEPQIIWMLVPQLFEEAWKESKPHCTTRISGKRIPY